MLGLLSLLALSLFALGTVQFKYINNAGGGFADRVEVGDGTTVGDFIRGKIDNPAAYFIRLNGVEVSADDILQSGNVLSAVPREQSAVNSVLTSADRVTVTPKNIPGAWFMEWQFQVNKS